MYVLVLVVKPFTSSRYARWLLRLFRKPVERGTKRRRFFKRSLDLKNPGRHFRRRRFVRSQVGRNKREDIFSVLFFAAVQWLESLKKDFPNRRPTRTSNCLKDIGTPVNLFYDVATLTFRKAPTLASLARRRAF